MNDPANPVFPRVTALVFISLFLIFTLQSCALQQYQAEPLKLENISDEINSWGLDNPGLISFLKSNGILQPELDSSDFSLKRLYLIGLYYNPAMQTAYREMRKAQMVAQNSNYKINPELGVPLEHHSDTSNGQSTWTIGSVLSFIYERRGKREARQAEARIRVINTKLALQRLVIDTYYTLERDYFYYIISSLKIAETENEIAVLRELLEKLQEKYKLGAVSQFEISTFMLDLQKRLFELNLLENLMQERKDRILAGTYLPYNEYENINIHYIDPLSYIEELYRNSDLPASNPAALQTTMLAHHVELALSLNAYAQAEAKLKLEIEKQYPDIVLSPGFIFDQSDNIWTLGASWVLPLFKNSRQNLQIRKALEDRKIRQHEIVDKQKNLLNFLYQKYNAIVRENKTLAVSDSIITSIEKRGRLVQEQLAQGGTDSIALLRNRLEYYRAKQRQTSVYQDAVNAMSELEQLLQRDHHQLKLRQVADIWIENAKPGEINEQAD